MKVLIFLNVIFLYSFSAFGLEVTTNWNDKYQKEVILNCSADNYSNTCEQVCDSDTKCVIAEKTCFNCLGSSVYLTHLFKQMGQSYRSTGDIADDYSFVDFLLKGEFATLTSKSIYNNVDRFNSAALRDRFQSLCTNSTEYPVVFLESVGERNALGKVRYVTCGDIVFTMTDNPDIDFNNKNILF